MSNIHFDVRSNLKNKVRPNSSRVENDLFHANDAKDPETPENKTITERLTGTQSPLHGSLLQPKDYDKPRHTHQ